MAAEGWGEKETRSKVAVNSQKWGEVCHPLQLQNKHGRSDEWSLVALVHPNKMPALQANF